MENNNTITENILGIAGTILVSIALLPQVYKVFKTKSVNDLSRFVLDENVVYIKSSLKKIGSISLNYKSIGWNSESLVKRQSFQVPNPLLSF